MHQDESSRVEGCLVDGLLKLLFELADQAEMGLVNVVLNSSNVKAQRGLGA
jgi:hypothetical protein